MESKRALWAWRVAGLALALMVGVAIRRFTAPNAPAAAPGVGPSIVAPAPAVPNSPPHPTVRTFQTPEPVLTA